jgi:DNA invertase Pin-like site-specific DNA recombinase
MTTHESKPELERSGPRPAYSLIRFSTPQQALGDSLRRQLERTRQYCEKNDLTLVESIRDEGKSGYHGVHRKRGAFGRFVERFRRGEIPPGGVFIAEAFDRFTREPPHVAQALFLELINGCLDVVTLMDGQHYSAQLLDANIGQLFMSIGLMLGAHQESKNKADRIREGWKGRRKNMQTNIYPSWFMNTEKGRVIDPAKQKIIKRIFRQIHEMGVGQLADLLNGEQAPTLNNRRRRRGKLLRDKMTIQKLIRGRQVLGEQQVGRYVDGKRELTGEVIEKAYPAVVTEAEWYAANQALDRRGRGGVGAGRNPSSGFTNLFGELARCASCCGIMKIRGKNRYGHKYLGCSNAGINGGCKHGRYYRVDKYERIILQICGDLAWGDDLEATDQPSLVDKITQAKAEAAKIERKHQRVLEIFLNAETGSLEDKALKQLSEQHKAKLNEIAELERRKALSLAKKPDTQKLQRLMDRMNRMTGEQLIAARGRIARGLPDFIKEIRFGPKEVEMVFKPGMKVGGYWNRVTLRIDNDGKLREVYDGQFGKPVDIENVRRRLG